MNETRTINLNGQVFHIDNDAYLSLSNYLQDIELRLSSDERQEVMADLEARICELLQSALFAANRQVVSLNMINDLKQRIGAPSDFGENKRPKVRPHTNNQGCGRALGIALKIFLIICALPVLFIFLIVAFSLIFGLFGASLGVAAFLPELLNTGWLTALVVVFLALVVILPIVMIIVPIVSYMRTRRGPKARFWWIIVIAWLLSLGGLVWTGLEQCKAIDDPMALLRRLDDADDLDDDCTTLNMTDCSLATFSAIRVNGPATVILHQADSQRVQVSTANVDNVKTVVQNGVLCVDVDDSRYTRAKLVVSVPRLTSIEADNACHIECSSGFVADTLNVVLNGASKIEIDLTTSAAIIKGDGASHFDLTGRAESCRIDLTGASRLDAEDFVVQDMHIACSGASRSEINVQRTLWLQAIGASRIEYSGNPKVERSMVLDGSCIDHD